MPWNGSYSEDDAEVFRQSLLNAQHVYDSVLALPTLVPKLATTAQTLAQNRDASVTGRKNLAQLTVRFKELYKTTVGSATADQKALVAAELAKEGRNCIKAYQEEIEALTKRCQAADAAFDETRDVLTSIPDPSRAVVTPALEHMDQWMELVQAERDRADSLEEELKAAKSQSAKKPSKSAFSFVTGFNDDDNEELLQLRQEVAEYEREFQHLQNQDITVRRLEAQIAKMEESKEAEIAQAIAEYERKRAGDAVPPQTTDSDLEAGAAEDDEEVQVQEEAEAPQDQSPQRQDGLWGQRGAAVGTLFALPGMLATKAQSVAQTRVGSVDRKHLADFAQGWKRQVQPEGGMTAAFEDAYVDELVEQGRNCLQACQTEIESLTLRCREAEAVFEDVPEESEPEPVSDVVKPALEHLEKLVQVVKAERVKSKTLEEDLKTCQADLESAKQAEDAAKKAEEAAKEAAEAASSAAATAELDSDEKEELIQLRKTVAEYQTEFQGRDDEEGRIRRLEAQIAQLQESKDVEMAEKISNMKRELADALERESELKRNLNAVQNEMRSKNADKEELIQLRKEVAEYEMEFRGLKNQDITIRRLETQISKMEESKEADIAEAISKVERELAEKASQRVADALEREAEMERKLNAAEVELRTERAGRIATQDQMLEREDGYWSQKEAAWEAQRGILTAETERLREELGFVRRERDELVLKVEVIENCASSTGGGESSSAPPSGNFSAQQRAYEAEVQELNAANAVLRKEMHALENTLAFEKEESERKLESLEHKCANLEGMVQDLEQQLSSLPSLDVVERMQRELRVFKRLEFNADHEEDEGADPEMTTVPLDKDIETVLVDRLRKMEGELVRERNLKSEVERERIILTGRIEALEATIAENQKLVESLESDLQTAVASASSHQQSKSASSRTLVNVASPDPNTLQQILDPSQVPQEQAADALNTSQDEGASSASKSESERANDDHSVVTIIMAQRDRLRARCDALEAEKESFKQELQVQVRLSESLKTDNTKLYEKVRYLQNFKNSGSAPVSMRDADLDLEALEERYEASVDPFRQFSRAERQRKLKEMTPMDRLVFMGARTLLSSKQTRTALFCYIIGMHLLVFFTTHHWSSDHGCHDILSEHPAFSHLHHGVPLTEEADLTNQT